MFTTPLSRLMRDERGATMIEYSLLIAFIGIGIGSSASILEEKLSEAFSPASVLYHQIQCDRLIAADEEPEAIEEEIGCGLTKTDLD